MENKFDWTNTAIYVAGKFRELTPDECKAIEDGMYSNMKAGKIMDAPLGEVLTCGDRQVPPEGFAGCAVLCYFSGQSNIAHQLIQHGIYGSKFVAGRDWRFPNVFNSLNPGFWSPLAWIGQYPYIMSAIYTSGQATPSIFKRFLAGLSYLLARPDKRRPQNELKRFLSAQVLYHNFPILRWCIKQYFGRLFWIWGNPSDMLTAYYGTSDHENVRAWENKGWRYSDERV